MRYSFTKIERETIIRYNDLEDFAEFDTRIKRDQKKLERDGFKPSETEADYNRYITPIAYARRWGHPRRVTENQRQLASERMKELNARKKEKKDEADLLFSHDSHEK